MAQTFQALKCYQCHTFQVQIKKKSNRWACKLCGEKQSFMQIYGEGSSKDCRIHVQRLNTLRAAQEEARRAKIEEANEGEDEASSSLECTEGDDSGNVSGTSKPESKWSAFLENNPEDTDSDSEEEEPYQPVNTHSRNKTKLSSKWADYLDTDASTTARGKTKRKADQMTSSNACSQMNEQGSPLHNGHKEEVTDSERHLYGQNFTSKRKTETKDDSEKPTKAFTPCSTAKRNHDARGKKRDHSAANQSDDQKTSKKELAKVFCSNESDDLDDVLKL